MLPNNRRAVGSISSRPRFSKRREVSPAGEGGTMGAVGGNVGRGSLVARGFCGLKDVQGWGLG